MVTSGNELKTTFPKNKDKKELNFLPSSQKPKKRRIYQIRITQDKCKGCGLCIFYCPKNHLKLSQGLNSRGGKYVLEEDKNQCGGCGFCYLICPDTCITIWVEEEKMKKK